MKSKYVGMIVYLRIKDFNYRRNSGFILVLSLEERETESGESEYVILTGIDNRGDNVRYSLKKKLMYRQMQMYEFSDYWYKRFIKNIFER